MLRVVSVRHLDEQLPAIRREPTWKVELHPSLRHGTNAGGALALQQARSRRPPALVNTSGAPNLCLRFDQERAGREHSGMARETIVQITDDLDGSKGAEEVSFAYQGVEYRIDLGKKNKAALEKLLKPYTDAGTKVTRRTAGGRQTPKTAASKRDLASVRDWAKTQGIEVSDRGRVAKSVLAQYDAAH